jgi:ABC-type transporter Mla MlaB component
MKHLFICLILFSCFNTYAQEKTVLKIMGHATSESMPNYLAMKIFFEEDKNVCDPIYGYESLEDKIYRFETFLKNKDIAFEDFKNIDQLDNYVKENRKGRLDYHYQADIDKKLLYEIFWACQEAFAKDVDHVAYYDEKDFKEEDSSAIASLLDAINKAKTYAKALEKENIEIINIDDLTSTFSMGIRKDYKFTERKLSLEDLDKGSSYGLWVTFHVW